MARSWHYPPWRRTVMQITLCAILAGTLGLAMLVSHRKMSVKLTTPRNAGTVWAKLPDGWLLEKENEAPVMFMAHEPLTARGSRSLTIRSVKLQPGTTTVQYLKTGPLLRGMMEVLGEEEVVPVTIAGSPGLMVRRKRPVDAEGDGPNQEDLTVWVAAAVLPTGQAISVELDCPVEVDAEADRAIVITTAEGISIGR